MSLSDSMRQTWAEEEGKRAAGPGYTGLPCVQCGRIRVYLRRDGVYQCEKCEAVQTRHPRDNAPWICTNGHYNAQGREVCRYCDDAQGDTLEAAARRLLDLYDSGEDILTSHRQAWDDLRAALPE